MSHFSPSLRLALPLLLALGGPLSVESAPVRYRVSAGSKVTFRAASNLHGFNGGTEAVTGFVSYDEAVPLESRGEIVIDADALRTGDRKRDNGMRKSALETRLFPRILMKMRRFVPEKTRGAKRAPGAVAGNIHGELTLHGVTRKLLVPAEIQRGPGGGLRVRGTVGIDMNYWGINPPVTRKLFMKLRVLPNVSVNFDLKLAPQDGPGPERVLAASSEGDPAAQRLRSFADRLRARQAARTP